MVFSYNWLKEYISKQVNVEKLADLLIFHSFEIEGIEKKGVDFALDIDVLSNRACDCLSHIGIAREACVLAEADLKIPEANYEEAKKNSQDFVKVKVSSPDDCSRFTAKVIKGIAVGDSPKWMQDRLKVCGLQPINSIVDITNYVMLETGQPLHAFDLDKLGKEIIVRRAEKGEKIVSLDEKEYLLNGDVIVVCDKKAPVSIAGIKGGRQTGIDLNTKDIVIEAANWNQGVIRSASRKLKLKTDASWRFENGLDISLIDYAQERTASLVQEIAGGKVMSGLVDTNPEKKPERKIKLDLKYVNKLLGVKIPEETCLDILEKLGFEAEGNIVKVPRRRLDVSIQEDLIEEIGRVYGYRNIASVFPKMSLAPPKRNSAIFWQDKVKNSLKEGGCIEVVNYSFLGESFGLEGLIEIENPLSSLNKYLRGSLIPGLLKNVKENSKWRDSVSIFEIGNVFLEKENLRLSGALMRKGLKKEGFYELKGVLEQVFSDLGLANASYHEAGESLWFQKQAEIKIGREQIGHLGEISSDLRKKLEIKERVFLYDVDFEKLMSIASEEKEYRPISPYPVCLRDLAVLVPLKTKFSEVLNIIASAGGKLVRDIDLFDTYSGKNIPKSKENLAFHIVYQSYEKTLSSEEVDKLHQKIVKALEKNPNWEVRK